MKAPLIALMVLGTLTLQAGPEQIIKQRAKDTRDQNNARQGVIPAPATPPAQPTTRPAQVVASPSQQSLKRFDADVAAIKRGQTLETEAKQKLAASLMGAAQGTKPQAATVDRFVTAVHKAAAAKPLPAAARAKLMVDLDAILNPSKYPQAKPDAIIEDVRSIFQSNGASSIEASGIANTARLMAAEVRGR